MGKPCPFPRLMGSYFFCRNPKYNDLFAVGHGSCKQSGYLFTCLLNRQTLSTYSVQSSLPGVRAREMTKVWSHCSQSRGEAPLLRGQLVCVKDEPK